MGCHVAGNSPNVSWPSLSYSRIFMVWPTCGLYNNYAELANHIAEYDADRRSC